MCFLLTDRARFLLAQLHMDSLRDKASSKLIKNALSMLPKGSDALDLAYDGAMQRIEDQMEGFRNLAKRLLGWIAYSERLMTIEEVQHALAIEPRSPNFDRDNLSDVDEIVCFCAGLVTVDEETQTIRLAHYTTQEYFRRNNNKLPCAQQDIAISCLTYLLYKIFDMAGLRTTKVITTKTATQSNSQAITKKKAKVSTKTKIKAQVRTKQKEKTRTTYTKSY